MTQSRSREIEDRFIAATLEYLADLARKHRADSDDPLGHLLRSLVRPG